MQKDIQLENVTIEEADKVEGGSMTDYSAGGSRYPFLPVDWAAVQPLV